MFYLTLLYQNKRSVGMYQSKTSTERHIMIFHNILINNFENTLEISNSCQQVDVTLLSTAAIKRVRCTWSRSADRDSEGACKHYTYILLLGRAPTIV